MQNTVDTLNFFLTVIFFGLAWTYEAIHFPRAYIFIIGFLGYAFLIILRMNSRSNRINISAYIASILLVILLEYNSRYIINYFIHILYILLIIELAVSLERKKDLWIGALIVVAGMYKYVTLIQYKPAISTYAEATFFLLLNFMSILVITLMQGLREEQYKLIEANIKLAAYSEEVKSLTEIKTRADIASRIHDGVGHNLTALIMQLEITSHLLDIKPDMARGHLDVAKETARDNLVKVRQAVKTLDQGNNTFDFDSLIRQFSNKTGVKISWEIDKDMLGNNELKECVYRAIQESLTNAIRHGKATEIGIELKTTADMLLLTIKDNGQVDTLPQIGYGLSKMVERFGSLSGYVEFEMDNGLLLKGWLPQIKEGTESND